MINTQIIRSPTRNTVEMLRQRMSKRARDLLEEHSAGGTLSALALMQGRLVDMFAAADIADKAAPVIVTEVLGLCPQHFNMIAIFGDVAAVDTAIQAVVARMPQM